MECSLKIFEAYYIDQSYIQLNYSKYALWSDLYTRRWQCWMLTLTSLIGVIFKRLVF